MPHAETIKQALFPKANETNASVVDSAVSTPQIATTPKTLDSFQAATLPVPIVNPPVFKADVPSTMDAGITARAISEPETLPQIPEQKIFQMADGRFFNPATGVSAATSEEAAGIVSPTPGLPQKEGPAEAPAAPAPAVEDDVTASIKALFPESDSLVKQYQDLRKSSGVETDEAALAKVNQEVADMNAVIQNIEEEVRAQAGGQADASFIAATTADRIRRLMPRINQLQARREALAGNVEMKKTNITQQLGFSQADLTRATEERKAVRQGVSDILETFGSAAFANIKPEILAEIEKRAGLPSGSISAKAKTLAERKLEEVTPAEKYGTGVIAEYQFYAEQERVSGRKPLSFDEYQTRDANRKARMVSAAATGGLTQQQFSRLNTIADNARLDPNIKEFSAVRAGFETARGAAASKNSAGDIVLMRMLAKVTDPTTGVREEEYRTFQNAVGTLPKYGVQLTKQMIGRGQLTGSGRAALLKEVEKIYNQREAAYQNSIGFFSKQAERSGGSAEDVLPVYTAPSAQAGGNIIEKDGVQYRKNPDGSYTRLK